MAAYAGSPPGDEQSDDDDLRRSHNDAGQPNGPIDAELHGQRANAEPAIAVDRFEVVQGHDPVRAEAVEQGDRDDPEVREARGHDRGAGEPGQAFVGEGYR